MKLWIFILAWMVWASLFVWLGCSVVACALTRARGMAWRCLATFGLGIVLAMMLAGCGQRSTVEGDKFQVAGSAVTIDPALPDTDSPGTSYNHFTNGLSELEVVDRGVALVNCTNLTVLLVDPSRSLVREQLVVGGRSNSIQFADDYTNNLATNGPSRVRRPERPEVLLFTNGDWTMVISIDGTHLTNFSEPGAQELIPNGVWGCAGTSTNLDGEPGQD